MLHKTAKIFNVGIKSGQMTTAAWFCDTPCEYATL